MHCYSSGFNKMTLILIALLSIIGLCPGFILDGLTNSYSQFRKWGVGTNGSLEFEFKTDQPNGLLLYTDDGGTYDFFEIKLVEGALRLRYNLGGGAQIITVGRDLNDGHWHKVNVQRNVDATTLSVDGIQQISVSRGKEFQFGRFATNSDVFVGGMPLWYNTKLTLLALPSVIFEPRFVGAIRNLVYSDLEGAPPRRQETRMKDKCSGANANAVGTDGPACTSNSITKSHRAQNKINGTDACETHDPCQHGGICISTDSGPICECRNPDYEGMFCEKDKAPSEAVFRGTEFLSYDLSHTGGEPIVSAQDSVTFYFKTRQPNGLLFYTGDGTDYLNVAIKDGGLSLTMGLANGKQEMVIKPNKVRFDDNQWHKVSVHRRIQEISAITSFCRLSTVVDGVYAEHSHIAGKFTMLSSSRVYVGGSINTRALPGARVHNNFVGCMRKVEFVADTLRLNLIELGRTGSKLITVAGRVDFKCPEAEPGDPITFTTRDSHLVLPPWNAKKSGTISFKFRTNEANGLILYNGGIRPPDMEDFFAIEILNGHIYIHLELGSGSVKVRASRRRVDDGAWHELILRRTGRDGRVTVDGSPAEFVTTGDSNSLELTGPMYVGGMGPPFTEIIPPAVVWTAVLRQGYVGCLRDFNINNKAIDIAGYARQQDSGSIKTLCHIQPPQCPSQPCLNNGLCLEGWNRFICDCTDTIFTGPTCGKEAPTLNFNGTQHVEILMDVESHTQTEDLILRFRTAKALGLLMTTNSEKSADRIEISVAAGRVRLAVRLGDRDKILLAGQNVNDNEWHTIRFSRRASNLKLQLDSQSPIRAETVLIKKSTLQMNTIHLGGLYHPEEEVRMTTTVPNFIGSLQQFIFNGISYIDLARSSPVEKTVKGMPHIKVAAKFITHSLEALHRPVTFRSKHTFVGLPMLRAYSTMHIDFMFKTREANGLIFFNGGRKSDFIAVELVDGHVSYVLSVGDGPIKLRDNLRAHLNDNRWHTVTVRRPTPKQHTLMVDDDLVVATTEGVGNLELEGILYLGGLHKDLYSQLPQELHSKHGFEGCLAGLDFNGESPNVLEDSVVHSSLVATGCEGQAAKCSHNVCANRGICVQQWHSYTCDCDMTSFTGPTCSDESVAYEFGPNRGIITYTFPEDRRPEMTEDAIALGFITTKQDAVLLRVVSGTSNDYIELEIVEGNVFMVYNMGTNDHPLGEISVKVNDNAYHVVRFRRSGANSTLQIDDFNVQNNHPTGHQLQVFNSQSQIQIGGKWNRGKSRVERPFTGILAGVVVNGMRVLDLAAEKDSHTSIRGDVQLMTGILERHDQKMQQTPASGFPGVMDDLVFSGAGSGCNEDDEDQCTPLFESGSGDDLITPVYVPPTRPPTTTPKSFPGRQHGGTENKPCDDEDCFNGSGGGETTTEEVVASTTGLVITHPGSSTTSDNATSKVPDGITSDSTTESPSTDGFSPTTRPGAESSPPEETPKLSSPTLSTDGSSTTILTTEPPTDTQTFRNPYYPTVKTTNRKTERVTSELSEIIALIIGIIAGALIAVILIILVILKFKSRSDPSYKVDDGKGYQQGPNTALLGNGSNGNNGQTQYQMNGTVRNGDKGAVLKKKRDSKDIKEWYV